MSREVISEETAPTDAERAEAAPHGAASKVIILAGIVLVMGLGILVGFLLDRRLHTAPLYLVAGVIVAVIAVYDLVRDLRV